MEKIEHIPISLGLDDIKGKFHLERTGNWKQVQALLEVANTLFNAGAVYKVCYIEEKRQDGITIDSIILRSHVLRKNLKSVERVFPYVVTIGGRLEETADTYEDLLEKYYLDVIGNVALIKARKYLEDHLCSRFALDRVSFMSPGSLADWPIEEQTPLFSLLEGVESVLDVRLNESLIMIPKKSVSGIYFPTETTFLNCQLCPRKDCPGRKTPYNEESARDYGILKDQRHDTL